MRGIADRSLVRFTPQMRAAVVLALCISAGFAVAESHQRQMGLKYSPLARIDASNVEDLELAWEFHTGELKTGAAAKSLDAFVDDPTLVEGNLVICTPTRRLIALDPATGEQRWTYDPKSNGMGMNKCRGVATWVDSQVPANASCRTRIYLGTADNRLVAIDAKSGKSCTSFGANGEVKIQANKPTIWPGEVSVTSRPAIVNGVVVVGSVVADNQRVAAPSGRVLAFDARTGKPMWEFDPIPRSPSDPAMATWLNDSANSHGGSNVWSEMAVDESLDLVYLPTTSPSVDFYGGSRPGANLYADSVVALKGSTGEIAWHFQFTHHNIWDYDTPSQPLLLDFPHQGKTVPALIQNTKTGLIFVFDRKTGVPLVPIVERPVPQEGAAPGEWLSPTQPFPAGMPTLAPQSVSVEDAWGFTPFDRNNCKKQIESLRHGPIYTPPSLQGTILQPSSSGGPNWGGGAYDPKSHIMVVPSNRVAMIVTLVPHDKAKIDPMQAIETRGPMMFPNAPAPYVTRIEPFLSSWGAPCTAPPWAALTAVDVVNRKIVWEVPLGSIEKLAPIPIPWELGTPGVGGPLITAGGVVFIGYTLDDKFRAFDLRTGETLWKTSIPAAGTATPTTYEVHGEQYVVIPAGGHSIYGSTKGDSVVAFKLKR